MAGSDTATILVSSTIRLHTAEAVISTQTGRRCGRKSESDMADYRK